MKKIIILAIVCSILITFSSCDSNEKPTYYHTEDVADFNKGIYSLEGYACFNYGVPAEAEVISFYYHEPSSPESHHFILTDDEQTLKILNDFHSCSISQDIWDTTYFKRIN